MKTIARRKATTVFLAIGLGLLALWMLGLASAHTLGGFIYVALLIGFILVFVTLVSRSRARFR